MDKAGKTYWDHVWQERGASAGIEPFEPDFRDPVYRGSRTYFHDLFSRMETRGTRLLEIGCAGSVWLPFFAQEFGFSICGIDYSEVGCARERQILHKAGVAGEIVCADFFYPPDHFVEAFDIVVSFGVVEHFSDTSGCLRAFARFLKPGGVLITHLPNLSGLNGMIQKVINRPIFDVHVPLDRNDLVRAHQAERFERISCRYFLFFHLGVLNFENWKGGFLYSTASTIRTVINRLVWGTEKAIPFLRPNRWTSPYIHCLAVKADAPRDDNQLLGRS
jgi:2-polyprenyl-3-methyl-5-hydroxy-6-metoxy-1,4-benzoquinol methylase